MSSALSKALRSKLHDERRQLFDQRKHVDEAIQNIDTLLNGHAPSKQKPRGRGRDLSPRAAPKNGKKLGDVSMTALEALLHYEDKRIEPNSKQVSGYLIEHRKPSFKQRSKERIMKGTSATLVSLQKQGYATRDDSLPRGEWPWTLTKKGRDYLRKHAKPKRLGKTPKILGA
jgi:hypothetical protein